MELIWEEPVLLRDIQLIWNDDVNEDLINLHHHETPFEVIPELVKDYRLEVLTEGGAWAVVHEEKGNRRRKRLHRLKQAVQARRLRIMMESTNGSPCAELIEVRAYSDKEGL